MRKLSEHWHKDHTVDDNKTFTLLSMALGLLSLIARYFIEKGSHKRRRSVKRKQNVDQAVS